jgi:hypothetical protein
MLNKIFKEIKLLPLIFSILGFCFYEEYKNKIDISDYL